MTALDRAPASTEVCWCTHPAEDHDAGECWAEVDSPTGRGQCACNWWQPVTEAVVDVPLAVWCAAVEDITGAMCKRPASECRAPADGTTHDYDGLPPWTTDTPEEENDHA